MWCKDNGCCYYKDGKCTRIGQCGRNEGKKGICWMDKSEGEY